MSEAELPSLPEPPAPLPAKRRGPRVLLASVAAFVVLLVALATGIGWALRSESGTAWLLTLAPGVMVEAPRVSLASVLSMRPPSRACHLSLKVQVLLA